MRLIRFLLFIANETIKFLCMVLLFIAGMIIILANCGTEKKNEHT